VRDTVTGERAEPGNVITTIAARSEVSGNGLAAPVARAVMEAALKG
jgi:hypothetical protein